MKKINFSVVAILVEIVGAGLATAGLAMISIPAALIVLGVFLVWITEKDN